ncbi:hypothetical protein V6N13_089706 [Hibiscus sabdariffa]
MAFSSTVIGDLSNDHVDVSFDGRPTNDSQASFCSLHRLWTRKEKEIAIVSHGGFLFHTLSASGNDCHPLLKEEICKPFENCELRSMVIADRSMIGFDLFNN